MLIFPHKFFLLLLEISFVPSTSRPPPSVYRMCIKHGRTLFFWEKYKNINDKKKQGKVICVSIFIMLATYSSKKKSLKVKYKKYISVCEEWTVSCLKKKLFNSFTQHSLRKITKMVDYVKNKNEAHDDIKFL